MKRTSILHVIHWPRSGIVSIVQNLLTAFDSRQFEQHVLFFEHDDSTLVKFQTLADSVQSLASPVPSLRALREFRRRVDAIRPDILHTHSFSPGLYAALLAGAYPHVVTVHCPYPYLTDKAPASRIKRALCRWYTGKARHIVAVSTETQDLLADTLDPGTSIRVIGNGILPRPPATNNTGSGSNGRRIDTLLAIGRLSREKSYDKLLRAFSIVRQSNSRLRLRIVGDGDEMSCLRQLADELDIADSVEFTGWHGNPHEFMNNDHTLFISSSAYEGFGLAIAEAMAAGLPVISTRISGIAEQIVDNETGFLLDRNDAESLATRICQVLGNDALRIRVGDAARRYAREHLDISAAAAQYTSVYREVIRG